MSRKNHGRNDEADLLTKIAVKQEKDELEEKNPKGCHSAAENRIAPPLSSTSCLLGHMTDMKARP